MNNNCKNAQQNAAHTNFFAPFIIFNNLAHFVSASRIRRWEKTMRKYAAQLYMLCGTWNIKQKKNRHHHHQ